MPDRLKYSEEELIVLLGNKDKDAFSYLYDNYSGALNGVLFKITEDRELSEDLLQDAFIKIWKNFSSYDSTKGRLFTWMINITRNLAIDMMRSKGYKNQTKIHNSEFDVNNTGRAVNEVPNFDTIGIRNRLVALKRDQQEIIDLAYFNGYTQDQISKILGIPLGTVKTKMRSAILELKKILQ
ncbi:MAG: sigma-70 family RNA polymerase sigma factor [Ferruginibacter sp.]